LMILYFEKNFLNPDPYSDEYNAYYEKLEKIHKEFSSFMRFVQVKQCLTLLKTEKFKFEGKYLMYTLLVFAFVKIKLSEKAKKEILELLNELLNKQMKKKDLYHYDFETKQQEYTNKPVKFVEILIKIVSNPKQKVLDLIKPIYDLIGEEASIELYKILIKKNLIPNPNPNI
jgi:hypothetical protein